MVKMTSCEILENSITKGRKTDKGQTASEKKSMRATVAITKL